MFTTFVILNIRSDEHDNFIVFADFQKLTSLKYLI